MKHGGFEGFFHFGNYLSSSADTIKKLLVGSHVSKLKTCVPFYKSTPVDVKFTGTLKHKCFQDKIFKFASPYDLTQLTRFSRETQSCEPLNMSEIG